MLKKHQKWIALLVTLTFAWLLQVSAMPLPAAGAPEQIRAANAEQGPRYIEEEGDGGYQPKKKSILPIVLIGLGVAAVAAVLFLVVLKTKYDIVGAWNCSFTNFSGEDSFQITFSGDDKSGTWTLLGWSDRGTYSVDGKEVRFQFDEEPWVFTGEFTEKNKMSGNHSWPAISLSGTWTATRSAAPTSAPSVTAAKTAKSLADTIKSAGKK
ncbi:MAG TPA: hypothetical protein VLQ89_06985 [Candidatus Binatia bacterium]|nr:hypothetical protein [Candidatus Binatia bacterium]